MLLLSRDGRTNTMLSFRITAALLLLASAPLAAQWTKVLLPDTPRLANGEPDLNAPAPKAADGRSDLSGIWVMIPYPDRRTGTSGRGGLRTNLPLDIEVPVEPWAKSLWDERFEIDMGAGRPSERCLPHTVPDSLFFGPFKIVQTPRVTLILEEEFTFYRQIHTDGRAHPENPNPAWFGYSVGSWDGDTLVVDTRGFKIPSWLEWGWFDDSGIPYSENLRVIERFRRVNFGRMRLDVTVEDAKVFTRPWTFGFDFALQPDTELIEFICENEQDVKHMPKR
jgi:hypothetical protein